MIKIKKCVVIQCDECKKIHEEHFDDSDKAEETLKIYGWVFVYPKCYCESCVEKLWG